ncbi:hypothetical protein ACQ86K_29480 [Mucilaginibacter sp. P19]|uniref:Immunity protein 44 n=2 Tax=Mucilaginibacter TaxID=423349 RepID=A0A1G7XTS4_9SPHI|nr:hypothetical protein [Mucilaginibacter gossypii]SDG87524.1 hypothetical protein SAMN05192573_105168 [Mucilaginibacter gossypii]
MKFSLLSDTNWETRVDKVLHTLSDFGYTEFFEKRNYGTSLNGVVVVFMCRDPELNFKQRIRHSKKEKLLYMDIMLDYNEFIKIENDEREKIITERLASETIAIIAKYKFDDFDLERFAADIKRWLKRIKLLKKRMGYQTPKYPDPFNKN